MSFSPTDSGLYAPLFADPRVAELFTDVAALSRMLRFEAELARAEGRSGVIPAADAEALHAALTAFDVADLDLEALRRRTALDGVPVAGLVEQLRAHLPAPSAAYLHWGATTQDVLDTALVLQLGAALELLEADLTRTARGLAALARRYRDTVMVGRTHGRQAAPITFGLKAAGWLAPLVRHRQRLTELRPRLLAVQLGGAAGTLAPLGDAAEAVRAALAAALGLTAPAAPWHTQRDAIGELAGWLAGVSASLGKMAQDVILLGQDEVGEVREGGAPDRGGSSTLPNKQNPIQSEMIVAAARAAAGRVADVHHAALQEHERGTHGWQLEWTALGELVAYASSALSKSARLVAALEVDEARLAANLDAGRGQVLAETLTFALARHLPRPEAARLVKEAARTAAENGEPLIAALRRSVDAPLDWDGLSDPRGAVGAAGAFVDAVLREADVAFPDPASAPHDRRNA